MKEININIEGYNVNGICVGCLNYNRQMVYHPSIKECFRLLGNIDVPDGLEIRVCWECIARVKAAIKFKKQILKSYDFLISYSKEHTFLDSPKDFSAVATTSFDQTVVECCICVPEEMAQEDTEREMVVKEEEIQDKFDFITIVKEEVIEEPYFQDVPTVEDHVTSDEDMQLSILKEKEEKVKKKRKSDKKREREENRMPANKRARTTTRGLYDMSQFEAAYDEMTNNGISLRAAARMYDITYVTLQRYKQKRLANNYPVQMGYSHKSFYTTEQEAQLTKYLKKYAEIFPGLCVRVVRKYGAEFAQKLGMITPKPWLDNDMAGVDWVKNFMHRNKDLKESMDKSLTKEKVAMFYDRLWNIMCQYNFESDNIYAFDQLGVNIEEFRDKVSLLTTKNGPISLKQSQVKFVYAANAKGYLLPSISIMPKEKPKKPEVDDEVKIEKDTEHLDETTFNKFLKNGVDLKKLPDWTEDSNFMVFLKHFTSNLNNSVGPKLLLLLENQTYHLSIECIDYCRENDIILLAIPAFMAQPIEPLAAITISLKKSITSLYQALLINKPEQKKSIYNIPNLASEALLECSDQSSIQDGFKNAGIFPYNREVIIT